MEFALWLPVIMVLLGGILDVGWYLSRQQNVIRAARDGARIGSTVLEDQTDNRGAQIEAAAEAQAKLVLDGLGMPCGTGCEVDALYEQSTGRAAVVVTVRYPFGPLVGVVPLPTHLAAQFTMMTQQQW